MVLLIVLKDLNRSFLNHVLFLPLMSLSRQKQLIRERMKQLRSELSESDRLLRSQRVINHFLQLPQVRTAKTVFCYVSFGGEVNTRHFIEQLLIAGKTVLVPKIINNIMYPIEITSFFDLKPNKLGIPEPIHSSPFEGLVDICFTPGLAFTRNGDRLGYGKGYYDQYFFQNPGVLKIALAYDFQILTDLPITIYDQKVDLIATESKLINCADELELGEQTGRSIRRMFTQRSLIQIFKNNFPFIGSTP